VTVFDQPIGVLVVDDHELLSSSLCAAFAYDGRTTVVGTAGSIAEGVRLATSLQPDVVLTDRRLPDGDVDEHVWDLRNASPTARIIMMTGWPTQQSSLAALDAGVEGIISKSQPVAQIIDAVTRVMRGELVVPASLAPMLLARTGRTNEAKSRNELSRRELDVKRPGIDGGSEPTKGLESWQHRGSTRRS
jgi:DNA-binding NarL/FixJ family response regulator